MPYLFLGRPQNLKDKDDGKSVAEPSPYSGTTLRIITGRPIYQISLEHIHRATQSKSDPPLLYKPIY